MRQLRIEIDRSVALHEGAERGHNRWHPQLEAGRAITYNALRLYHSGFDAVKEVTMAKLKTQRDAFEQADDALQIFGGAGYMKEYGIERAWRDMRLNRIGAGTDEVMLDVIGRSYGL